MTTVALVLGIALLTALALTGLLVWARDKYADPEHAAAREYLRRNPDWPHSRPTEYPPRAAKRWDD